MIFGYENLIKRKSLLLMVFFLLINVLSAQIDNARVERITINEGLSQNYIYDIFQDSRGFLWFGTKDGLNRYDGYNFKIYRHNPHNSTSLSNNNVTVITQDKSGNFWIGTLGGGLNKYNRLSDNFTRFLHNPDDSNSISDNFITAICCCDTTGVWIGTNKGQIDYLNFNSQIFTHYKIEPSSLESFGENEITGLYMDNEGILWIASKLGGFDSFDLETGQVKHLIESEQLPEKFRLNHVNTFVKDSAGIFWIARYTGLVKFDPMKNEKEYFQFGNPHNKALPINGLVKSDNGNIWLLSQNSIILFNSLTKSYKYIIENYPSVFSQDFLIDRSGIFWLGTQGQGLLKIDPGDLRFNIVSGNFISMIYGDVLTKHKKKYVDLIDYDNRGMNFQSIIRDKKKNYWVAAHYWGLYKISSDSKTITKFNTSDIGLRNRMRFIDKVFEDRNGGIWVTTIGGIDKFNETDKSFKHYQIYTDSTTDKFAVNKSGYQDITAVYQDRKNIFWLGTPTMGIVRFDPSNRNLKYYHYNSAYKFSLNNNFILTIAEDPVDPDNILWIGTEGGGLNRFDKTNEKFIHLTIDEGLPNNVVYGILSDKNGFLWMSTNKGISKYNPINNTFRNYDINDGLQSNEFNRNEYFKTADGEMFFGGICGFNHFYPEQISDNKTVPQLVFTDFQLSGNSVSFKDKNSPLTKPIWETDKIILHHYDNIITFEFAALDFSSPDKNKYSYQLEGLHEDWIDNGNSRMATFTNLDPGEYIFRVKGCNADGTWSVNPLSISLVILPAYWETWWFRTLMFLLILSAGLYIIKRKSEHIKIEFSRKNEFSRKLIESQENERKRIAMELHDGTGQNLLLIKNNLYSGLKHCNKENGDYNKFEDALEVVNETIKEIKSVSQDLRPQTLDHIGLTTAVKAMIEKVSDSSDIEFGYSSDNIDAMLSRDNEIHFYRIVQEALNNILKHSSATEAAVQIQKEKNTIKLLIRDNGKGFAVDDVQLHKGFGMNGMFERAGILDGKLEISSSEGKGAVIKLEIST